MDNKYAELDIFRPLENLILGKNKYTSRYIIPSIARKIILNVNFIEVCHRTDQDVLKIFKFRFGS